MIWNMTWIKSSAKTESCLDLFAQQESKNILLSVGYNAGNWTLDKHYLGKKNKGKKRKKILVHVLTDRWNRSQYFSQAIFFLRDTVKYFRVSCDLKSLSVLISGRKWKEFKRKKKLCMRFDKTIMIDYWVLIEKVENTWST